MKEYDLLRIFIYILSKIQYVKILANGSYNQYIYRSRLWRRGNKKNKSLRKLFDKNQIPSYFFIIILISLQNYLISGIVTKLLFYLVSFTFRNFIIYN